MNVQLIAKGALKKISRIAEGTYGVVYKATNNGNDYAVKRMKHESSIDFVGCLRELDFLARFQNYPFVLCLVGLSKGSPFESSGKESPMIKYGNYIDDNIYLISEYAAYDCTTLIKNANYKYIKLALLQTLLGLEYLHGHGAVHRDIKPSNLLWFRYGNERYVKICDFGISKMITSQESNSCSVVTALYRAPEILLKFSNYDYKSDIWSLGCTFYEIISKEPFLNLRRFNPDKKNSDNILIQEIFKKIPELPNYNTIISMKKNHPIILNNLSNKRKNWYELIDLNNREVNEFNSSSITSNYNNFIDLLNKMMKIEPSERFSSTQALNHIFFDDYRNYINETRELYPPMDINYFNHIINIKNCQDRCWIEDIVYNIYNNRDKYYWYHHRILFHAIDMFDQYLNVKLENVNVTIDYTRIYFLTCLYISIKYFLTLTKPCNFKDILDNNYYWSIPIAEDFEWIMIKDVLQYKIYRPTIYETADHFGIILTEEQIKDLFVLYMKSESLTMPIFKLFERYATVMNISLKDHIKTNTNIRDSPMQVIDNTVIRPSEIINSGQMIPTVGYNSNNYRSMDTSINIRTMNPGSQTVNSTTPLILSNYTLDKLKRIKLIVK